VTWGISAEVSKFDEALGFFRSRTVLTGAQAQEINDRAKVHAFWVGGGLQLAQVQRVFDALDGAIEKGEDFESFRKRMRDTLQNRAHAETVFRNATQRAYNAGRWTQMNDPAVLERRPYWMYDSILDGRTTVGCLDRGGTLLPAGHEWFLRNWPPRHHKCRAGVRNLTRREGLRRGVTAVPPETDQHAGFGLAPSVDSEPPKPKPSKTDPALLRELKKKRSAPVRRLPKPPPDKPKSPPLQHTPEHWLDTYKDYGEAATSIAWGRAAMERGLDMRVSDVRAIFAGHEQMAPMPALLRRALRAPALQERSLRELGELNAEVRMLAARAGHKSAITSRGNWRRDDVIDQDGLAGEEWYAFYADKSVRLPGDGGDGYVFKYDRSRGGQVDGVYVRYDHLAAFIHEVGHSIEHLNPQARRAANAFLRIRRGTETPVRLKSLFPNANYRTDEFAIKDKLVHAYIGKIYSFEGTEISSMALEGLHGSAWWGSGTKLMQEDPDFALFGFGVLAGR
jgi:SPP1 gp7 family putative phage head morphogenesis protein